MKLKRVRIAVEPLSQTHARWKKALGGKSVSKRAVITVASWEVLGRILSPPRLQLLTAIPALKPKSISALARATNRDFKNVYSDVRFLADIGLVDLRAEGPKKILVPVAKFGGIELTLAA